MTVRIELGDCRDKIRELEPDSVQLVVTSPPYNIGKEYEMRRPLDEYLSEQGDIIRDCVRVLRPGGSLCWQVGNFIHEREVIPLDAVLYPAIKAANLTLRNRVIWTFGHGAHCKNRLSGRHEVILWATKGSDYYFDLDPIRVPQKYPEKKHYKGPKKGQLSGHPLGKNPGDVWAITNVKNAHPEKTAHPCQFPEELVRRLVLSLTKPGDLVLDPYGGSGTTGKVCDDLGRDALLFEKELAYVEIAENRVACAAGLFK